MWYHGGTMQYPVGQTGADTPVRVEIELRVLPRFRVLNYLEQLGGTPTEAFSVTGDGWQAAIVALEPDVIGRARIPRDCLVIEGEAVAVERVASFMQRKVQQMRRGR